ncbi:MAG: HlyD family efflux transporter periplasmic adaptor subunit [Gammaproteobacteria bacterium]|nr:HlyD family efflux transporter periplasmic adaptor subunit [Gammaproteobacteria bacterium]
MASVAPISQTGRKTTESPRLANPQSRSSEVTARVLPTPAPGGTLKAWLAWQCRMISGIEHGELFVNQSREGLSANGIAWPEGAISDPAFRELANRAMSESALVAATAKELGSRAAGEVLGYPVINDGKVQAVVVLVLKPRSAVQFRAVIQLLQWGVLWLQSLLTHQTQQESGSGLRTIHILRAAQQGDDVVASATAACDLIAKCYGFSRVTIGMRDGLDVRVVGISGDTLFDPQSLLARDLEAAMSETIDHGAPLLYPASKTPSVSLQNLSRQHGMPLVCVLPMGEGEKCTGALVLERSKVKAPSITLLRELKTVAPMVGRTLHFQYAYERSYSRRLHKHFAAVRQNRKMLTVAAALAGALALLPVPYRITGDAMVEGEVQRAVVAPADGFIAQAGVRAGDEVSAGDVLAEMERGDLSTEQQKWQSERDRYAKEYGEALAGHDRVKAGIAQARMTQADAELKLVSDQLERAVLRAPFDGVIVRGDLSRSLGAAVERGDVLFEVAPLTDYRLTTEVDEHDILDLEVGQHGVVRLAGMPGKRHDVIVERISPIAVSERGKTFFRVESRLESADVGIRPGMQGVAKFEAGKQPLLWTWTRSTWSRVRLWIWSLGI